MSQLDLAPLYRSAIGFERLFDLVQNGTKPNQGNAGYPPYNIELIDETHYRITVAVAGFEESELNITSQSNVLVVTGRKQKNSDQPSRQFLYQGIAERDFERSFQLADHIVVTGASIDNGLLHIDLEREIPEKAKPRQIPIQRS